MTSNCRRSISSFHTAFRFVIALAAVACAASATAHAAPPGSFEVETVATGLFLPTDFEYAPDGHSFVAEKGGVVRVIEDGIVSPTPVISLTNVNDYGDRGLLGLALDPDFASNGYLYLAYTHENTPGQNYTGPKTSRVVRVTVGTDHRAIPGSETIIIGAVAGDAEHPSCGSNPANEDCISADGSTHTLDDIAFGPDGMLYISIGDAASFDVVDPLAHRASDLDSLNGKVLRVFADGSAPEDNPFYTGDPAANRSKVWNAGLRNPFRIALRPSNGSLFIGDVGWYSFEELNVGVSGADFGWPCREGFAANPGGYPAAGSACAPSPSDPLYAYAHNPITGSGSITGGMFYDSALYPIELHGAYFFGDFSEDFIKYIVLDADNNLVSVNDFIDGAGGPVAFGPDHDGNVAYLSIYTGELRRIVHTNGNRTPLAAAAADPTSGFAPLEVSFSSAGSSDPDGDELSYAWEFGDGGTSELTDPSHLYSADGSYVATLTVTDTGGKSDEDAVTITVGNRAPTASIAAPPSGSFYAPFQFTPLSGVGTDAEDGVLPQSAYAWEIRLHHNVHYHVFQFLTGSTPSFVAPDHGGTDVYLEIILTVKDSGGLTDTASILMHVAPPLSTQPYHAGTVAAPVAPRTGESLTVTTSVGNTGSADPFLIDIELFDEAGGKIAQRFYDSVTIDTGTVQDFTLDFVPAIAGVYRVAVGLIYEHWQGLFSWVNDAITLTVSDEWSPAPPNGALRFDGVDDYVNTEVWDIEEPHGFTLEARFVADSFEGDTPFIAKASDSGYDWMFGVREVSPTEGMLVFLATVDGVAHELTGGSLSKGELTMASAVYDNSALRIYIDGVEIASAPATGLIARSGSDVWLGASPTDPAGHAFHGMFDEIRVWNEPQSAGEIAAFQAELTEPEFGLIKNWRFNEGFGQVVIDRSNSGHHGHLGSAIGAADANDPTWLAGTYQAGGTFAPSFAALTVAPAPVPLGTAAAIAVEVHNGGSGAGFMIINVEVYTASGEKLHQTFFDGEGFAAGETRTFSTEWTPTETGTYRIAVGLVHLFWGGVYEWVNEAAFMSVTEETIGPFAPAHAGTVVLPDPSSVGGTATITTTVQNTGGAGTILVNLEVYDNGVKTAQTFFDNVAFAADETKEFTLAFTPTHAGTYGVAVGFFEAGWTGFRSWIGEATTFVVSGGEPGVGDAFPIYDDELAPGFASWSWDGAYDLASVAVAPEGGERSVSIQYEAPWAGFYLHHDGLDTGGFSALRFSVNGGSAGGQGLQITALGGAGEILGRAPIPTSVGAIPANDWADVSIVLSDFGAHDATITGIILQGSTGLTEPPFFIDTIRLE